MSIKLMSAAWELDIPQTEKMVLLCLCDHANDDGECWPSIARMARKCSVSQRTVQRAIQSLKDKMILDWHDVPGRSHKFTINPRHIVAPDTVSPPTMTTQPPTMTTQPPTQCHPTPDTVSPKPSYNHQDPSEDEEDFSFSDFVETWNSVAGQLGLKAMRPTKGRKTLFEARKREFPDIADWQSAFGCLRGCKWMHGDNDRGWLANPDFFLRATNFIKLVENQYGQAG